MHYTSAGIRESEAPQIQVWGPYNRGSEGEAPSRVQGRAPGQGISGGFLKHLWLLDSHCKSQIGPLLKNLKRKKIRYNLCCFVKKW